VNVCVLAGGFGGARMAHGFALLGGAATLSVVGNTGDDLEIHGLYVSPDLDTVMYTLAGLANEETGWGVRDETWSAAQMLARYGEPTWFRLGDRDLATHVVRTQGLRAGARLTEVTRALRTALGVNADLLPMSDDPVRTKVQTADGWLDFQDYFVRRGHAEDVTDVRFHGVEVARPTAEVIRAIDSAQLIVIAPSNPFVSVAPILSIEGIVEAIHDSAAPTVAISPIVGGAALRGPAAHMLRSAGREAGVAGIAAHYAERHPGLIDILFIDEADAAERDAVAAMGIRAVPAPIVMPDASRRAALARTILETTASPTT
jgi:LPPG:FO 2-phospho-L-lactate transferase